MRLKTVWKKENFASALGIPKENKSNHAFVRDN